MKLVVVLEEVSRITVVPAIKLYFITKTVVPANNFVSRFDFSKQ